MNGSHPASRPVEILLIEDNPGDVVLMQEAFKEAEVLHRLSVASNGDAALALLRCENEYKNAARPNLILLDLNLPGQDGQEVLAEIRHDKHLDEIPVVVLTSSENDTDEVECYRLKANRYITKPTQFDDFIDIVRDLHRSFFNVD